MRCGKQDHQPGQRCPAKNANCKACGKIGHIYCVCQSKKRTKQRANLAQSPPDDDNTHIDESGVRQPNPPLRINMLKVVNHTETNRGKFNKGKHLKFPIVSQKYNFLYVQLSVCPHEIQNFRNSAADISILGQFCTYLDFRTEKYLNTFIVTNKNDCSNLLSLDATFRMGVLVPNYPKDMVLDGANVPHFSKMNGDKSASNVFQILVNLQGQQQAIHSQYKNQHKNQCEVQESKVPFRTTTPSNNIALLTATKQVNSTPNSVHVQALPVQNTSWSGPPAPCAHVHTLPAQTLKLGDLLALRKVKTPHNGRSLVTRLPLTKQQILSQYSSCFEGIRCFPGKLYKFHLKPEHKPARHALRKVPIHFEDAFKEEIKSLVKLGILEEVKEHTDWVNSYVTVEKESGNHHVPNHTMKRKLRICLDPRDLNETLEREPYHTHSVDEITAKLQGMTVFTIVDFKKGYWMVVLHFP